MQEKRLLRDALEPFVWNEADMEAVAELDDKDEIETVVTVEWLRRAAKAFASTTEETEMEKLVVWLKCELNDSIDRLNKAKDREWRGEPVPEMERPAEYHAGQGNFCGYALDYITTQFGEEEGNADREGA